MAVRITKFAMATLAVAFLVSACEQKDSAPAERAQKSETSPAPAKEAPVVGTQRMGPPYRPALPLQLMESRLNTSGAGTITLPGETKPRPLAALGVNVCNTGWVLVGYIKNDGRLEPTPSMMVNLAEIPTVPFVYESSSGGKIALDFDVFGWEKVRGTIEILGEDGEAALSMKVDAAPINVHNDPGLAASGCYTTGYYKIGPKMGAVASVFDGENSYHSRLRLDDRHDLVINLETRSIGRDPKNVYRASLARVFENPEPFPMRVYLERRTVADEIEANSTVTSERFFLDRVPLKSGELVGSFVKADEKGPVRWVLEQVQIPEWSGPLAGEKVDLIKVDTYFATDSPIVPLPRPPNWEMQIGDADAAN